MAMKLLKRYFIIQRTPVKLLAATSADFPAKVPRPRYSVLDNRRLRAAGVDIMPPWTDCLRSYLRETGELEGKGDFFHRNCRHLFFILAHVLSFAPQTHHSYRRRKIVGLATAVKLSSRFPDVEIVVLEKESSVALHQSGNNSGVLHAGLYYKPGSLKARLAVAGIQEMTAFCRENNIQHEICGKLVVAVDETEVDRLHTLLDRGRQNGLQGLAHA